MAAMRIYFRHTKAGWRAWRVGSYRTGFRAFPIAHERARQLIASGQAVKVSAPPKGRGTKWLGA
jgi:hypothetical protein